MNIEGISITKLLVITVLVILLLGTRKLRILDADFGAALKGFKKALGDDSTLSIANNSTKIQSAQQQSGERKNV